MKTCTRCGEEKPLDAFYAFSAENDKRRHVCKACQIMRAQQWQATNPERYKATNRKRLLKSKYGITPEQYDAMLTAQRGLCACCETASPGGRSGVFCVDHDHDSGEIRGLLCNDCNRGIGLLGDTAEAVAKALEYLR